MSIKSWKEIEGKWNDEPDLLELEKKGCHMVVLRNPMMGNLNGYVGVSIRNPLFALHYDHSKLSDVWVHGGLTFSGMGSEISFAPFKKTYWYFGFDTAHAMDLIPSMIAFSVLGMSGEYKDLNYVSEQVNQLADQLKLIAKRQSKQKINHKKMYRKLHKTKKRME